MPTYDYQCDSCKKTYEARESFSAPMEHECQECGKGTAKRLLSAPTILFKGSGWYATDSRKKSGGSSDDESKPTTSLPEAAKSESTPAAAAESSSPSPAPSTPAASST